MKRDRNAKDAKKGPTSQLDKLSTAVTLCPFARGGAPRSGEPE